ncbi:MAG TPA: hypothetical protein VGC21_16185 [Telluria sp.]|jgi:hypothetical protein
MAGGELRDKMPLSAALIDDLRSAFGKDFINGIIRAGMAGDPVFSITENGHALGTPVPYAGVRVLRDEAGNHTVTVAPDGRRHEATKTSARRAQRKGDIEWEP